MPALVVFGATPGPLNNHAWSHWPTARRSALAHPPHKERRPDIRVVGRRLFEWQSELSQVVPVITREHHERVLQDTRSFQDSKHVVDVIIHGHQGTLPVPEVAVNAIRGERVERWVFFNRPDLRVQGT